MAMNYRRLGLVMVLLLTSNFVAAAEPQGLIPRFSLPASPIEIRQPAKADRFFDTMARKAGVLGSEGQGFEAWVYPLKLFHDCRITAAVEGTGEIIDLGGRIELVSVKPEAVTITAAHSQFTIREVFFTPLEQSGSVLLLDIDSARPLTLTVRFVPDLKPMWPAGLGGQYAAWNEERHLFVISEGRRKYNGLIGSPAAIRGSTTPAHELGKGTVSFDIKIDPAIARKFYYPIIIAGSQEGRDASYSVYDTLLCSIPREYENLVRHCRKIREEMLSIDTPEPDLNLALEWSKVAFDRGLVTNPDLGTGLIAGWGLSGESARPGFGWFFGGDTFVNQYAISAFGGFEMMRQGFRFLQRRQRADGKMMHELTQSAAWIKWFEEYPYGYYHGDTTPFYLASFYDYYRQSGDRELLKESWDSLKKAFSYCESADEDGDGLMDNTRAGLGASELGSLLEGLKTDILLGALSPAAWRAMAAMADEMGDKPLAGEAHDLYQKAMKSAAEKFWSPENRYLVHALTQSGGQNRELTVWPAVGILLGIFPNSYAEATVDAMASGALSTDWGTRMLANSSKAYDPVAYNNGAVWPFLTGLVSTAEFVCHRAFSGYQMALANARLTRVGALGYHPELLSGDYYRPLETAVPHQLFSSGGVVAPIVRGLLGLEGDATKRILSIHPHLPPGWEHVGIRRYRIGDQFFDIQIQKEKEKLRFVIEGGESNYGLRLSPALGLFSSVRSVLVNGRPVSFKIDPQESGSQDIHCLVETVLGRHTEVELNYEPGIELDAPISAPEPGDASRNIKILKVGRTGNTYTAELEGLSGSTYQLRIWTVKPILGINGGTLSPVNPKVIEITLPSVDPPRYVRAQLGIQLKAN